jgi:Cu+-exporting ATPase
VKAVVLLSVATTAVWSLVLGLGLAEVPGCGACWAIERGIGVLVASCPCALGLAVPSVVAIVLKLAARSGILIKKTRVFEQLKGSRVVAFDKTGTLFTRIRRIEGCRVLTKAYSEERLWEMLALLERDFRHPLAEVLYKEALTRSRLHGADFSLLLLEKRFVAAQGLVARLLDKTQKKELAVEVGNKHLLGAPQRSQVLQEVESCTQIYLCVDGEVAMVLSLRTRSSVSTLTPTCVPRPWRSSAN